MPVKVYVTQMLARHVNAEPEIMVTADDLDGLLSETDKLYPGFRDSVCNEAGRIRVYVNVFLNGERLGQESSSLTTKLKDGDEVYIVASVAGG